VIQKNEQAEGNITPCSLFKWKEIISLKTYFHRKFPEGVARKDAKAQRVLIK
jgi:hypothetical protein